MPKKPETPKEWALYRCKSVCDIGREAAEKGDVAYAVYCLLRAVGDLAEAMSE